MVRPPRVRNAKPAWGLCKVSLTPVPPRRAGPGLIPGRQWGMCGSFDNLRFESPFVLQDQGIRSLHFTHGEVQSSMRVGRPDELQVDYTRTMMGFLLLDPQPRRITMIGLGGGSLVKFCHRHLRCGAHDRGGKQSRRDRPAPRIRHPRRRRRLSILTDDGALSCRRRARRHRRAAGRRLRSRGPAAPAVLAGLLRQLFPRAGAGQACWWSTFTSTIPNTICSSGASASASTATRWK